MALRLQLVQGALALIGGGVHRGVVESLGISKEDWELATGSAPWLAADRPRVNRTLTDLVYGSMDAAGLPRFDVPAEYAAAVICAFVAPSNIFVACDFLAAGLTEADSIVEGREQERIRPAELFAFCLAALGDGVSEFQQAFERNVGRAIEHAVVVPVAKAKGGKDGRSK